MIIKFELPAPRRISFSQEFEKLLQTSCKHLSLGGPRLLPGQPLRPRDEESSHLKRPNISTTLP